MGLPISYLRDNFEDNSIAPTWLTWPTAYGEAGSATRSEASGQAQIALPNGVAGGHRAAFFSAATYDISIEGHLTFNIAQMVSTSVVADALLGLISDNVSPDGSSVLTNQLRWYQLSGTLKAQKVVSGVATDLYSVTWNATTHKYLRIQYDVGSVYFLTSSDGTTWVERADATVASLGFSITDLHVVIFASCSNVVSPGTLKIEDVNGLSLSTNWRNTQVVWSMQHRFRSITLAGNNKVGYIAASQDGITWRYFAGPLGSASGLYNQLVEYSTQAAAEAMATDIPFYTLGLGRWDLPAITECRYFRLYHRSKVASTGELYEFYPRRLVQADDIEAEKIRAIHIAANSITADRLSVIKLSAIVANIGQLFIDTNGYLFQGTGSGTAAENAANPTSYSVTGLKIYHSSGIGILSTYNAGVEQIKLDTDGRLKAGAGNVVVDATGIKLTARTIDIYNAIPTVPNVIAWQSGGSNIATIEGFIDDDTSDNVLAGLVETSSSYGRFYIKKDLVNLSAFNNSAQGSSIVLRSGTSLGINYGTDGEHHFFVDGTERVTINSTGIVTESYIAPSFSNSWVNFGGAFSIAGYFKDKYGIVHLRGLVKNGTMNAAIFTLPAGYRPAYQHIQSTFSYNGTAEIISRVDVDTSGNVLPVTGGNNYFSLDGISFRAA